MIKILRQDDTQNCKDKGNFVKKNFFNQNLTLNRIKIILYVKISCFRFSVYDHKDLLFKNKVGIRGR